MNDVMGISCWVLCTSIEWRWGSDFLFFCLCLESVGTCSVDSTLFC